MHFRGALLYAFFGLLFFLLLYHGITKHIVDKKSFEIMTNLRNALGVDGCILYGGVVEEVLARWGLMNLTAFFILIFTSQYHTMAIWGAIFISGMIFAVGQLPAYLAAGCASNRKCVYSLILLSLYQSFLFGYLFWQYGLITAILAHMLFHLG